MVNVTVGQSFHWSTACMGCSEILGHRASRGHLWSFDLRFEHGQWFTLKMQLLAQLLVDTDETWSH